MKVFVVTCLHVNKWFFYIKPIKCCMTMLTNVIAHQQQTPRIKGFPPVFTSFTMLLLSPIAAIAITMKNLLRVLSGAKNSALMPRFTAIVVTTDARTKYSMNIGNARFMLKLDCFCELSAPACSFFAL